MAKFQDQILPALVAALSGRTWDGKEMVLQAVADVTFACKDTMKKVCVIWGITHEGNARAP